MSNKQQIRQEFLNSMIKQGFNSEEVDNIWENVSKAMFETLASGGIVPISGVGKLSGEVLPAGVVNIFGEDKKVAERLQIKFHKSRTADNRFKKSYSKEAKAKNKLKAMAKLLK